MRKLILTLALLAGGLAVADYLDWRREQRRILGLAAASGADQRLPDLQSQLARETVPARAAERLAWQLLGLELERGWLSGLPAAEREAEMRRGLERLQLARRLAREVLAQQPAAWRAAAVLGTTSYLERARLGRQDQSSATWKEPLRAAMRLAPGRVEPALLLASLYLSRWSNLTAEERKELSAVLARAFEEPRGLRRLLPAWVRLAPSLDSLLEPIPDRPGTWQDLGREFLRLGDLERFGVSHQRYFESLQKDLAARVENGRARLRGGQPRQGLEMLHSVFAASPDLAYLDSFLAALKELPDGEVAGRSRRDLETWLVWANDLCSVGRCPLDAGTMSRLARAAGKDRGLKLTPLPDPAARATWPADDWRRRGSFLRLPLLATAPGKGLRLEFGNVPPEGGALELSWNGRFVGVTIAYPEEPVTCRLAIEPGLHLLQVRHLSGRPLRPRELTLEPAPGPS